MQRRKWFDLLFLGALIAGIALTAGIYHPSQPPPAPKTVTASHFVSTPSTSVKMGDPVASTAHTLTAVLTPVSAPSALLVGSVGSYLSKPLPPPPAHQEP